MYSFNILSLSNRLKFFSDVLYVASRLCSQHEAIAK